MNLIKYDTARHALQEAASIDEVKNIRDKALAVATYAQQAKDPQLIAWATEIRVRAERKAGEMLAGFKKSKGGKPKKQIGRLNRPVTEPENTESFVFGDISDGTAHVKTLADLGISKDESANWQQLAAIPEEEFEISVATAKEKAGKVTISTVLKPKTTKKRENSPCDARTAKDTEKQTGRLNRPVTEPENTGDLSDKATEEVPTEPEEYTEIDKLNDEIIELKHTISHLLETDAIESLPEEQRISAEQIIMGLREENRQLSIRIKGFEDISAAHENERNAMLKRIKGLETQNKILTKELKEAKKHGT